MIAGAVLLVLGFIGLALRQRGVDDQPDAIASDKEASEPDADLDQVEVYNRRRSGRIGGRKGSATPMNRQTLG